MPVGPGDGWDDARTRLSASTEDPDWYVEQLSSIPVLFRIVGSAPLRAARRLSDRPAAAVAVEPP